MNEDQLFLALFYCCVHVLFRGCEFNSVDSYSELGIIMANKYKLDPGF